MKPKILFITVGVRDLERSLSFYRDGLGMPTEGIIGQEFEHGAVAFFDLSGGLKLALWSQADIAHDTGLPVQPVSPTAVTIGHNVTRPDEVDQCMMDAVRAGAEVIKPAAATPTTSEALTGTFGKLSRTRTCFRWRIEPAC